MKRAFDFAARQLWAIQAEVEADGTVNSPALKRILDIALRAHQPDFDAVAQRLADRADDSGVVEMRGSVAVVNIIGPIFRYADFFTEISGAATVQQLAAGFRGVLDDPAVTAIVLNIDSPGGEVAGISEFANAIYDARGVKPIAAYADDMTASAAYWIASAASQIVASDTAELGSIGVVGTIVERGPREGVKAYQFVSSQSPMKRPNMETDEGRAVVQQRIDDLAAVFVATVARNRGVDEAKVLAEFGQGGMMIASKAVAAGMADSIGNFEGLVAEMNARPIARVYGGGAAKSGNKGAGMKTPETAAEAVEKTHTRADVDAAKLAGVADGRKSERDRWAAILGCEEAKGRYDLALAIASKSDMDVEGAKQILAAAPVKTEKGNPLAAAMTDVPNPGVGAGAGEGSNDAAAEAQKTVAAYKAAQGVK